MKNNEDIIFSNSLEWALEFPQLCNDEGNFVGFDIVVGNPPYIDFRQIDNNQLKYLQKSETNYKSARPSLYQYFIEQSYKLLRENGLFCFINPSQFLSIDAGYGTRKFIIENTKILFIDDVSHLKVFDHAATYTIVWAFQKTICNDYKIRYNRVKSVKELGFAQSEISNKDVLKSEKLLIISNQNDIIIKRIENNCIQLGTICDMAWGTSQSGYGKKKILRDEFLKLSNEDQKTYSPILQTRDIKNYFIDWKQEFIPKSIFSDNIVSKFNEKSKILIARMTLRLQAAIDENKYYVGKSTLLTNLKTNIEQKYLLAILNSKLINFWYSNYFENTHMAGGYIRFDIPYLKQIPIKEVSINEQKKISKKVENIIKLKQKAPTADTSKLEAEIDEQVYKLYNITLDEIKIIEKK